jgi:hypothetical protein
MRILYTIIERAMLARFYPGEHLALSGSIALQFISEEPPRDIR